MKRTFIVFMAILAIAVTILSACTPAGLSGGAGGGNNPDWDKSSVSVSGKCVGDSAVFTVTNGGSAMTGTTTWRIYVDDVLTQSSSLTLGEGESTTLSFTYPGQNVRLEVDQRPGHPGYSLPQDAKTCGSANPPSNPPENTPTNTPVPPTNTAVPPTNPPASEKISICHATGSATNPYVLITVSVNAVDGSKKDDTGADHAGHANDIIPAPADGCPKPEPKKITLCHATGSATNPYVEITVSVNAADGSKKDDSGADHQGHPNDIIPMPADGCPKGQTETPKKITICHATGSTTNPYVVITVSENAADGSKKDNYGTDHAGHADDIIPAPADGCPKPDVKKITICHATGSATNPYVVVTVSVNAADGSKKDDTGADHQGHPNDIIPMPADGCPKPEEKKITICHATGSETNPYVEITVSINAANSSKKDDSGADHAGHLNDIIPMPADGCPKPEPKKVTICHATGSETNPYLQLTVSVNAADGTTGHEGHPEDIIPMPVDGCPKPEVKKVTLCHATGSETNPYREITVSVNAADGTTGHEGHSDDIIPMPANGCPTGVTPTPTAIDTPTPSVTPIVEPTKVRRTRTPRETPTNTPIPTNTPLPPPPPIVLEEPQPEICQEYIVFHSFRDQNLEIYTLTGVEGAPNSKLVNISDSNAVDSRPSRSPDDSYIVFQSNRNGNVELYFTDASGSSQTRLTQTTSNNINAMVGPDSKTIVFQSDRNGNWDIFSVNYETGEEKQLTSDPHSDINPYFSPDLRWVVFQSNRNGNWDIFLLDTETGNEYTLVATSANEITPAWSPNGKQISYLTDAAGTWNLHVIDTEGKNDILLGSGNTINATWSPEGNRIAYQSDRDGNVDIYSYDLLAKKEYHVTTYAGADSAPTWNCGGTLLSYTTSQSNNPDIFQVNWQGGASSSLTNNPATDKWSEWSPSKEQGSRGQ